MPSETLTNFWHAFFVKKGMCSLCGNSGLIDTRGATTAAGVVVGDVHYCICPNGQVRRERDPGFQKWPDPELPDWVAKMINRKVDVENALRRPINDRTRARNNKEPEPEFVPLTIEEMNELANKLSIEGK